MRPEEEINQKIEDMAVHFGLKESDIVQDIEGYDDEFLVSFGGDSEYAIEVVDESTKDVNEIDLREDTYSRLIGSEYYFRWL